MEDFGFLSWKISYTSIYVLEPGPESAKHEQFIWLLLSEVAWENIRESDALVFVNVDFLFIKY